MKRRHWIPLLALMLAAAGSADGQAQSIPSPYRFIETSQRVGVTGGYVFSSEGALGLGPQSAPFMGARYSIRISGPFTAEGEVGFVPTTRMVWDTVAGDTTRQVIGEANMSIALASAALRFNITGPRTWHRLQPFLILGGGLAIDLSGEAEAEEDLSDPVRFDFGTSFAGHLGGGVEWFLSPGWSLRVDGRNTLWKLETPDAFFTTDRGLLIPTDEWAQNFVLSAGLAIHF
jgi:hypothetical protein